MAHKESYASVNKTAQPERTLYSRLARKPAYWEEIRDLIPRGDEVEFVAKLPRYDQDDLFGPEWEAPLQSFSGIAGEAGGGPPQWFVVRKSDGSEYLVDTEGYDYCRYIGRL